MFTSKSPEEFAQRVRELLENSPAKDIEKNFRAFANAALGKANLVTREEFDAQSEMLAKACEKIDALDERIRKLGEALEGGQPASPKKRKPKQEPSIKDGDPPRKQS
jgi:BMFP domain-containing protein YqiC